MGRPTKSSAQRGRATGEARGIANRTNPAPDPTPRRGEAKHGSGTHGGARGASAEPTQQAKDANQPTGGARASREGPAGKRSGRARTAPRLVESPADLADVRPGEILATRDHEVIRSWAAQRDAEPAQTGGGRRPPALRLRFPGAGGEDLEATGWDGWLRAFDDRGLVFVFQEKLKNGAQSDFFRVESARQEES